MILLLVSYDDEPIASATLEKLSDALSRYVEKKELLCKAEELMATSALSFGPRPDLYLLCP